MPQFTDVFPGTHITSWADDEGFDMVTVGVPGVDVSLHYVTDYDEVLHVWDMMIGHCAPNYNHPLYVALDALMSRNAYALEMI